MSSQQVDHFPFSAVSGQASFKLALILAAINPTIGGVLISGPRGSAKSTLARGLADLLPGHPRGSASADAPLVAAEFVTLPLGASEEMLLGTLDLQQVLSNQNVDFRPGLLSKAHDGVLYVDEVNLLADNLVDLLLDVAASGINRVERDGISHSHAAEFLLVGTMNPDEGELRPQLQDRFGLSVELSNQYSTAERVEIVRTREAYDRNPRQFCLDYAAEQGELLQKILRARKLLGSIGCSEALRVDIAERCSAAQVDGLRADIVWYRAALAHAAWSDRSAISQGDIDTVEELVLAHRRKHKTPPQQNSSQSLPPPPAFRRPPAERGMSSDDRGPADNAASKGSNSGSQNHDAGESGDWGGMPPQPQRAAEAVDVTLPRGQMQKNTLAAIESQRDLSGKKKGSGATGARAIAAASTKPGWFATLVASAGVWPPKKICFEKQRGAVPVLHLLLIDTSASTLGHGPFSTAKAVALQIGEQAYLDREQLAIFGFGNDRVDTLLPRIRAPKELAELLNTVPAGGGTPLREALQQAQAYLQQIKRQTPAVKIRTYLLTDGRTNATMQGITLLGDCVVIDTERSSVKRGRGKRLALELNADYLPVPV